MLPAVRTLIIAPHPDDDVIAAAGAIQHALRSGAEVGVLFVTDGDNNPWPQRAMERKLFITRSDRARWGVMRRTEALCSLAVLGLPPASASFLGLPDQGMTSLARRQDPHTMALMRDHISSFRPTLIISPSALDLHPDHRAIAFLVHRAAADAQGGSEIATYVVHGNAPIERLRWKLPLAEGERELKRRAIECHASQLFLSRQRFLSYAQVEERFYRSEYDLVGVGSPMQERLRNLRQLTHVLFGSRPRSFAAQNGAAPDQETTASTYTGRR